MKYDPKSLLRKIKWKDLRHWPLLLFWPLFGLLFGYVERGMDTESYHLVESSLDKLIPFCEYFLIPYLFWFVFLGGMVVYSLLFDARCFVRFMGFIILTYSVTLLIYVLFPNAQALRPASFERDNVFTRTMAHYYIIDTNTNVCPSLHVTGSVAAMLAGWDSRHFSKRSWKLVFFLIALSISMSTVFLKQHSILDIFAALLLCAGAYPLIYGRMPKRPPHKRILLREE